MVAKVCIICEKEVAGGMRVEDDFVIRAIRSVKRRFGWAKNNELYVCHGCHDAYRKKRANYERDLAIHVILAAVVLVATAALPLFGGGFNIASLVLGVLLAAIIIGLSLFSHIPKASGNGGGAAHAKANVRGAGAKAKRGRRE